ncbi:hypothetical protein ES703_10011 [subsurface metagenome]
MSKNQARQHKKTTAYLLKHIDHDHWKLVKQFAIQRDITIGQLIITALDQYMNTYHRKTKE